MSLAEQSTWDDDTNKSANTGGGEDRVRQEWMKFPTPGVYHIRLIGNPVKYLKHNDPPFNFRDRIITSGDYKAEDKAWQAGFYPGVNYAIFMIDRADGHVKILDRSKKFFEAIKDFKKREDIEPGGKESPDFVVTVVWPADKDFPQGNKRRAQYSVANGMKCNKFTEEEMVLVKAHCSKIETADGEKVSPLQIIYRSTPLEDINDKWDALPEDRKIKKEWKKDGDTPAAPAANTSSMEAEAAPVEEKAEKDDGGLFDADDETAF